MDDDTSTIDVAGDEWEAALIARTTGVNTEDPESEEEEPAEEVVVMSRPYEAGCFPDEEHTCVCQFC